jgi:putative phosphoesterase
LTVRIGIISDTHDLVRPEALLALRRSDLILHAGDVCRPEVLEELGRISPVIAVRGNNDSGGWARALPVSRTLEISGFRIHVLHDVKDLDFDPKAEGVHIVVSGHSHKPGVRREDGILFLNPGSAGPRRFRLPVAVARVFLGKRGLRARILELRV